jgi:hypothetical protein
MLIPRDPSLTYRPVFSPALLTVHAAGRNARYNLAGEARRVAAGQRR